MEYSIWGIMDFGSLEEIVEMGYQYSLVTMRETEFHGRHQPPAGSVTEE